MCRLLGDHQIVVPTFSAVSKLAPCRSRCPKIQRDSRVVFLLLSWRDCEIHHGFEVFLFWSWRQYSRSLPPCLRMSSSSAVLSSEGFTAQHQSKITDAFHSPNGALVASAVMLFIVLCSLWSVGLADQNKIWCSTWIEFLWRSCVLSFECLLQPWSSIKRACEACSCWWVLFDVWNNHERKTGLTGRSLPWFSLVMNASPASSFPRLLTNGNDDDDGEAQRQRQQQQEWWGILIDSVDQLLCTLVQQDPVKDKGGTCGELIVIMQLLRGSHPIAQTLIRQTTCGQLKMKGNMWWVTERVSWLFSILTNKWGRFHRWQQSTHIHGRKARRTVHNQITEEAVAGQKKEHCTLTFYTEPYRPTKINRQ